MAQTTGKGGPTPVGLVRSTAYGSAYVTSQCANRLPFKSETLTQTVAMVESEAMVGQAGKGFARAGNKTVGGGIVTDLVYTASATGSAGTYTATGYVGNDYLYTLAMGSNAYASATAGTKKIIGLLIDDATESFSLFIDKAVETHVFHGAMVKGFSIKAAEGGVAEMTFDIIAQQLALTSYGTALTSYLPAKNAHRVLFNDFVFRLGSQGSIALASTDNIGIKDFSFNFSNNLSDAQFSSPDAADAYTDGTITRQPVRNGLREVTLEFTLPRYQGTATNDAGIVLQDWQAAGQALQFSAQASCAVYQSGSTGTRSFDILIPQFKITDLSQNVDGYGAIETKVKGVCYRGAGWEGTSTYRMLDGQNTPLAVTEEFVLQMGNTIDGRTATAW